MGGRARRLARSLLVSSVRTISNRGSRVQEPLLAFTSTCPLKVQISLGLGPFFQISFLKTCRIHTSEPDGFMAVHKIARFHDSSLLLAPTAAHIRTSEPPWRFEPFHSLAGSKRKRRACGKVPGSEVCFSSAAVIYIYIHIPILIYLYTQVHQLYRHTATPTALSPAMPRAVRLRCGGET